MLKKIFKTAGKAAVWLALAAGFILFALHLALQYLLPSDYIKNKIICALADYTKMSVQLDDVRGGLGGLRLEGLSVRENGAPLLSAQSALVRVSPLKLLKGEVSVSAVIIEGLAAYIERKADGSFNFDKLTAPSASAPAQEEAPQSEPSASFDLRVAVFQVRNAAAVYIDRQNNIEARAEKIFIDVRGFSFDKPFSATLNANLYAAANGVVYAAGAPFGISVYPELKNLDMQAARARIKRAALRLAQSDFILSGSVENFTAPQINLNLLARRLDAAAFSQFAAVPDFYVPQLSFDADARLDLAADKITVNKAALAALSSSVVAGGFVNYGSEHTSYNFNVKADIALGPLAGAFAALQPYQISGALTASADITQDDIKAEAELKDAAAFLPQAGGFTDINFNAAAANINDIKLPALTGRLNGRAFSARASYLNKGKTADVNFFFRADEILAKTQLPAAQTPVAPTDETAPAPPPSQPAAWPLPPLNIRADVAVGNLDSRYFRGGDIVFKADVKNITPDLAGSAGHLSLHTGKGQIKDLYRLTNANALTKVLFMSLGVVSKVVNALDVLSVLKSIGAAVASGGKKTAPEDETAGVDKLSGRLDYYSLTTELDFKAGAAELKNVAFASDKISFAVEGGINFASRAVDMTAHAAPGNVSARGIMPLTLKIGGTIEDPKGSMGMLASTAALVKQSLLNNPASNLIKSGLGGLGGLLGISGKKGAVPAAAGDADGAADADVYIPLTPAQ
ncbi:MAG: AsmA family protein [Elusimicrobiota bacterium]|jgi:hypothetical protein|nr:AsmA family protein [Elusimicrobiota bacterium]